MEEGCRLATVQLGEHRRKRCVARPRRAGGGHVTRHNGYAICVERVEGIIDLAQSRVCIGQRQRSEQAEAARMVAHQLGGVLVAFAGETFGFFDISEPWTRRRNRKNPGRDAIAVHRFDRARLRPAFERRAQGGRSALPQRGMALRVEEGRRKVMMMQIDPPGRSRRLGPRQFPRQECAGACRRRSHDVAPRWRSLLSHPLHAGLPTYVTFAGRISAKRIIRQFIRELKVTVLAIRSAFTNSPPCNALPKGGLLDVWSSLQQPAARTRSVASPGRRSYRPSAQRCSMARFWLSLAYNLTRVMNTWAPNRSCR